MNDSVGGPQRAPGDVPAGTAGMVNRPAEVNIGTAGSGGATPLAEGTSPEEARIDAGSEFGSATTTATKGHGDGSKKPRPPAGDVALPRPDPPPSHASLRTFLGRFRRARQQGSTAELDPERMVENGVELIVLLSGRGADLPQEDVATVMRARQEFEREIWTSETAAEVAAAYARLCRLAEPATLASLRYAHRGGSDKKDWGLIVSAVGLVAVIIVLQFLSLRISDIGEKIVAFQATETISAEAMSAQLARLGDFNLWLLTGSAAVPEGSEAQSALLADAQGWALALNSLILPGLYGVLGAIAFIMRNHPINMKAATVTGDWTGEYVVRIVLGLVAGVAIGLYLRPQPDAAGLVLGVRTPIALSFLAGYAVELLFGIMDRLVTSFSSDNYGTRTHGSQVRDKPSP